MYLADFKLLVHYLHHSDISILHSFEHKPIYFRLSIRIKSRHAL